MLDDPSGSGCSRRRGFCAGHRQRGPFRLRPADRQLGGLVPAEDSSGQRRRLGHISKRGNTLVRFLLVEAAQMTVRKNPRWRNQFFNLAMRRGKDRESGHGGQIGGSFVLDVAPRMEVQRTRKLRFARGTARTSPWCAVNHRPNDCASRSSSPRGVLN
jgi:Transposase IS116/IS110/IS902 family